MKKPARAEKREQETEIPMTPARKKKTADQPMPKTVRVVKGKKLERRRRARIFLAAVAAVIAAVIVLSVTVPVSISESVMNLLMPIGAGKYPIDLYGTQTLNAVGKDFYYYVLTDADLTAVSNAGKKIYSVAHGYANPVLKTSSTRAMVYDQGGEGYMIYNLNDCTVSKETKDVIRAATVSRSGNYAVVSDCDSYTAAVRVYSKKNKLLFEWFSAVDMVNQVTLSASGKRLAVATVNGSAGQLNGKVMIFDLKKTEPIFTADFPDTPVLAMETFGSRYLGILTEHAYTRVHWKRLTKTEHTEENPLAMARFGSDGGVLVYRRSSDRTDNRFVLLSRSGEVKTTFKHNGMIGDISKRYGHIYGIGENEIFVFDKNGNLLKSADCPFGGERLAVTGSNTIALLTDSGISSVELNRADGVSKADKGVK